MADRSVATPPSSYREILADLFITRMTMLGAAAFGFLVTFLLLGNEIHAPKNIMLPLLGILPVYLFLASLNTWWAARTAAKMGLPPSAAGPMVDSRRKLFGVYKTCFGLAFGVIAALWYVHSVSK